MAVIIECDRCKDTVRQPQGYAPFNVGNEKSEPIARHGHLCPKCARAVLQFISAGTKEKTPAQ